MALYSYRLYSPSGPDKRAIYIPQSKSIHTTALVAHCCVGCVLQYISASPTACPLCGHGRAGTLNDRLSQRTCRRRCRDRADIEPWTHKASIHTTLLVVHCNLHPTQQCTTDAVACIDTVSGCPIEKALMTPAPTRSSTQCMKLADIPPHTPRWCN